jgi:methyl-accepting chemotaxis protein
VSGIDAADFWHAFIVFYVAGLGRSLIIQVGFKRVCGPIDRWLESAPSRPDARELQAVDDMLQRGPIRVLGWVSLAWLFQLTIGTLWLLFVDPYDAAIPPRAVMSVVLMGSAIIIGGVPMMVPLMSVLMNDSVRRVFALAHGSAIELRRERTSLKSKLLYLLAATTLFGPLWIASTSTQVDTKRATIEARWQSTLAASDLAREIGPVDPKDTAMLASLLHGVRQKLAGGSMISISISNPDGTVIAGERKMSPGLAPEMAELATQQGKEARSVISPRDAEAASRVVASNDLVVVAVWQIGAWTSGSLMILLLIFFVAILTSAPVLAVNLSTDVLRPIQEITRALQQITEVGKLDEVAIIPVTQNDETGLLSTKFNDLVDMLRALSAAASALARGDLETRMDGDGDVATAFRAMIESLGRIVRQIHETSVLLAAAATEIYAASQEQEAAAASQSTAMAEIRQTMESLFEAAAHVAESVRGVLSNAERTLETTDRMVVRIGDLTNHAGRIGEILETIRDISDRSDLLALNGALEASRAGEAGRGFGLVAAEMRRLAERVMSSVHDVRSLVGDIRASGSSTMMATEDSKKLAASTTDAARQITMVTQQQRSGTEQVLQSVREIAETLAQSVAAMAQSRASAEQLKSQADKLSTLVRAFRIENPQS